MSPTINLFTIGFAGWRAAAFFARLRDAGVAKVIDTRRWPSTQLSGFAKQQDLSYFLRELVQIDYEHNLLLAPTKELLDDGKAKRLDWDEYTGRYLALLAERDVAAVLRPASLHNACLLCTEHDAAHCHRRLLAEYLQQAWAGRYEITISHL